MLYTNYWGDWLFQEETWYLVAPRPKQSRVSIWRWQRETGIEPWLESGPREGIVSQSAAAINPTDRALYLRGILSGKLFKVQLDDEPPSFKRVGIASGMYSNMVFWKTGTMLGGSEPFRLEQYYGPKVAFLDALNKRLPGDMDHPSQDVVNTHRLLLSGNGDDLAVSLSLYDKVIIFTIGDRIERKIINVAFPGYIPPPEKYISQFNPQKNAEYFEGFHQLTQMVWHDGSLYCLYKKGYSSHGTWVNILDPKKFTYDNDKEKEKLIAIGPKTNIMGTVHEDSQGEVTWALWQVPSLP
jgi:hypothetical protein